MSLVFNAGSCPSSISDDYCMEENRLSSLEGLPQASWPGCYLDHVVQREIFSPWFPDFNDSYDSSVLPVEEYSSPWKLYLLESGVLDDSKSKKGDEPQYGLFEDVAAAGTKFSSLNIPIDWSLNSTDDSDSYGDSESFQIQQEGFSPPLGGESYQLCNRFRDLGVRKLDGSSPENGMSVPVEEMKNPHHQGYWHLEVPQLSRCCPKAGPDDLLSGLRSLLSVLKNHVERDQILRTKMQELRKRKEALHLQIQQYQNEHKRQRVLDR